VENNGTDINNAGAADTTGAGVSDTGAQNNNGVSNSGIPGSQGGTQTDPRDEQLAQLKKDNIALNRALVEGRRGGKTNGNQQEQGGNLDFETPEGQYAVALQVATNNLRSGMEKIFSFYPEIPASEIARVRQNPWAFANQQSYMTGDYEQALLEIEQSLLDRAEEIAAEKGKVTPENQDQPTTPAAVNTNPNPTEDAGGDPGTEEDEDPWTMPIEKLEKQKNKAVVKMSQSDQK
jgi:hypothetical protein